MLVFKIIKSEVGPALKGVNSYRSFPLRCCILINSELNEMNRALGHCCAHTGQIGPGEPLEDGEMSEITLPYRHRIRNSNPEDLRPSMLTLSHGGSPHY